MSSDDGYPTGQIFILALCRFSEPCAFTSIFPYLFFLVKSFGIEDEKSIGFYAGLLAATFPLCEFCTALFWGRMSDRYGRKPIILFSAGSTIMPFLAFGFSRSLGWAMVCRAITGLVNGNAPVIRTMIAEMVPNRKHHARAFSVMPTVWSVGVTFGPMIGGALADPVKQYPQLFGNSEFFKQYPFALPNIVASCFFAFSFVVAFLFIKETHSEAKYRTDYGLILKDQIYRTYARLRGRDTRGLGYDGQYRRADGTSNGQSRAPLTHSLKEVLLPQVAINIALHAMLGLHNTANDTTFPLFASGKREEGGLGFSAKSVGFVMTFAGVCFLVTQIFVYPKVQRKLGSILCIRYGTMVYTAAYLVTPLLKYTSGVWTYICSALILAAERCAFAHVFPSNIILLTGSVPMLSMLGTVNGLAQSFAAASRGIGPLCAGPLWALLLRLNVSWLLFVSVSGIAATMCVLSFKLEEPLEKSLAQPAQESEMQENNKDDTDILFSDSDDETQDRRHLLRESFDKPEDQK